MAVMPSPAYDIRHYRSRLLFHFFFWRPRILAAFIAQIDWEDLYPVLCTSKALHDDLLSDKALRDVLLCRFVPGYASCLKHRDLHFYQEVPIKIRDLHLLLISQRTELHRFPTHALRILTALYPTYKDEKTRARLISLTQAHSRFVLLLQSLVHSSPFPILPDPPEDPTRRSRWLLPELTFPAPLAFTWMDQSQSSEGSNEAYDLPLPQTQQRYSASSHGMSLGSSTGIKPTASPYMITVKNNHHPHGIHMSSRFRHSSTTRLFKTKPRLSILSRNSGRLPPPPEDPMTLRIRSKVWRRTSLLGRPKSTGAMTSGISESRLFHSASFTQSPVDESGILLRPKRLFAADQRPTSSVSSLSDARSSWNNGESSRSSYSSPPVSPQDRSPINKGSRVPPSIHSLLHAAIRNRAPILRVFVPTQHLSQPSSPEAIVAIEACEQQLQDAGLWEHLSTGDVVCNFGYIPIDDEGDNKGEEEDFIYFPKIRLTGGRGGPEQRRALKYPLRPSQGPRTPFRKTWLIFDGTYLVPFTPPSHLPLTSTSPLSLPSPFYYHHILPPHENSRFIMSSLPPALHPVTFSLVCTTTKVRSPNSPTGYALIKKFVWTARFTRNPSQPQKDNNNSTGGLGLSWPEIGEGWLGEWVLEYEGTLEGRQALVDVVQGRMVGQRLWEVVREKTGGGRIWLRLIP